MRKSLRGLLSVFLVTLALTGCNEIKFDESKNTLIIGLECDYAPFNWTETSKSETNVEINGQKNLYAEGYDIQVASKLCKDLGYTLVVKKIAWEGLIPALTSGDIDAIIAGMSPTSDRKESINFTNAYYESEHVVVVKKDGKYANATCFADFAGANVIGQKGTAFEELASQLATKAKATNQAPLATVPLIVSSILLGDCDVTVVEKPVALGLCSTNDDLKYIELTDKFEIEEEKKIVSIGIRKVDTNLCNKLNASLAKITKEDREALMLNSINTSPKE